MPAENRITPGDWPDAVADPTGPQLVVGGPGTGKTEFLVRRAVWLLQHGAVAPEQLLLLSFSRRGVADLKSRVERQLRSSFTAIPASTFHSLASRLLETHAGATLGWQTLPTLLTGPEQVALVHELLESEDPSRWPLPFRGLLGTLSFAKEVTDFLLRCQEQLIATDRLSQLAADRADWKGLPEFLARYTRALSERHRLDYGTLLTTAVRLLDEPHVRAAIGDQYHYVLTDEYQDTTAAQVRLLQRIFDTHRNLTVAADPYQSIYSFRGADLHNVHRFPEQFPDRDGRPAQRLVLTTSFRVPAGILEAAERVTAGSLPGAAGPVTPAAGEGSVESYGFGQQTEEAEWIANEVDRLHLEQRIPYSQMAIFVRSKRRFLQEISRALERRGIPHDLPDSRLADHPAVRVILDCVIATTEPEPEAGRALRRVLLGPLFSVPLGRLREIERARLDSEAAWSDAVRQSVHQGSGLAALIEDPAWATRLPAVDGFWHVWAALPQFASVVDDPNRRDERAAWTSLAQVLGRLYERNHGATLVDYVRLTEEEDFEARPLLSYRAPREDRLTLTTLHQSKGLEFDTVFIADAVEGVFPDLRSRESLLGSRHLSPSLPSDSAGYRTFRLQEEMRLAYTAMTRAHRRVVWTATSSGMEEGQGMPSRFLPLVSGVGSLKEAIASPAERSRPVTPLEAEAWLRRIVRDPGAAFARRLAALAVLATGERWGLRPATEFAGIRTRGPDRGVVPADLTLSPSQAESYATCPRRYAFERRLHVGDEPTVFLGFGSLIHGVLERTERLAAARGDVHAELDEALQELDVQWDPSWYGGEPWATAWHRRATQILTHLYQHWPSKAKPVALERQLQLQLDGITWYGKADRIEIANGAIRVVDYKTGSRVASIADAATSLQLGFYVLAAREDAEIAAQGHVAEAELWFPAQTERKSVTVRRFDPEKLDEVVTAMKAAAEGIAQERWPATANVYCTSCRVRPVCPEWPEGKEAFST